MTAVASVRAAARRFGPDVLAGISVAMVLVPQSLAYAELAGMPPARGLYAAALPPLVAAAFASSPYLQTGPTALTSLLAFGALASLAPPGSDRYVLLAGVLALIVGLTRLALGLLEGGRLSYLISQPVLQGFTLAAAFLILSSQLPAAFGVPVEGHGVLSRAVLALESMPRWSPVAIGLTVATLAVVVGGRRIHPIFPGVLVAVIGGIVYSVHRGYAGPVVGAIPSHVLAPMSFDPPWTEMPRLAVSGVIIGLIGFAEVASISQALAERERLPWDPDREFVSQGAANLVAGLAGGFPIGGSFSRSAVNHMAGARSRLSGAITGLTALLFVPFAAVLEPLPRAILAGIVIASVLGLLRPRPLVHMFRDSPLQGLVGAATLVLTVALEPHIEYAVLGGIVLAMAVHVYREQRVDVRARYDDGALTLAPMGVIWFGSAPLFRGELVRTLHGHDEITRVDVDLAAVGRIDLSGAMALRDVRDTAHQAGFEVRFVAVPPHARRIMSRICPDETETRMPAGDRTRTTSPHADRKAS